MLSYTFDLFQKNVDKSNPLGTDESFSSRARFNLLLEYFTHYYETIRTIERKNLSLQV